MSGVLNAPKGRKGFQARPLAERLMEKVEICPRTKCWNWTGTKGSNGYGRIIVDGRSKAAHRVVYEWLRCPIPQGKEIDHLCSNKSCVNPAHLEAVTHSENMIRSLGEKKKACKRGHEYNSINTLITRNGDRDCRLCHNFRDRRARARRRAIREANRTARAALNEHQEAGDT